MKTMMILYFDGTVEEWRTEDYWEEDGCLWLGNRYIYKSAKRYIPLDQIKEYRCI